MWYGACFGGGCLVGMAVMMFLLSGWVRQYTKVEANTTTNSAMDAIALLRQWDKYMVIGTSVNLAELLRKTREIVQQHQ